MNRFSISLTACLFFAFSASCFATGHGPVFGFATPVNSQGEWSFDFGLLGRTGADSTETTARSMITYGFTPHIQWSLAVPGYLSKAPLPPSRNMAGDVESDLAWRFYHNPKTVGTRLESTAYAGVIMPGPQAMPGPLGQLHRAPGFTTAVATGLASRGVYLWGGAGISRYAQREGDRRPTEFNYSLVMGYRPAAWRKGADAWDWRIFGEMTGEAWDRIQMAQLSLPQTAGHQIFFGPSALGIYKTFAIEGGVQAPIYRGVGARYPHENLRFAINVSYFLFSHTHTD